MIQHVCDEIDMVICGQNEFLLCGLLNAQGSDFSFS